MAVRATLGCIPLSVALLLAPSSAEAAPDSPRAAGSKKSPASAKKTNKSKAKKAKAKDGKLSDRNDRPWLQRWGPERGMLELGVFGGVMVPARDLELFEPRLDRPRQGFLPLARVAPEVGLRLGYFPLKFLGIEAEGAFVPTTTLDDGHTTYVFSGRGHLLAQLPFSSVAPFIVVGGGVLGLRSEPETILGQDIDPALHLGIGTKFFINRRLSVRLDLRDVISPRRGSRAGATNTIEALLGLSLTFGRKRDEDRKPEPPPKPLASDRDDDGFLDEEDRCPDEPGVAPDGCPAPGDRDADGFIDEDDACPDEPGVAPDGCPDKDADGDGIEIPDDICPDEPETVNNFEDDDGCPDEVPEDLKLFEGRLEGVNFDHGEATLTSDSRPTLDKAVEILRKYSDTKIEISGHTDNSGAPEINMRLSQRRADAVKKYLVDAGIDGERISTRGAGPNEPIDSNATAAGRANNRRIEFRVRR